MLLRFASRDIERICTDSRYMTRKLGADVAKRLRLRVAELQYVTKLGDLLEGPGRWEPLVGNRGHQWPARLSANWRLIVEPPGPGQGDAILVVEVVDYHK